MGLQRPTDRDEDIDLDGAAESLGDLDEARLVSSPARPKGILLCDDAPPRRAAPAPVAGDATAAIAYPEWDWSWQAYQPAAAWVRLAEPMEGSPEWVARALERNRATLQRIRRRFEALRARRSLHHQQAEGDELDLEAFVAGFGEARANQPRNDRVYVAHRPARLDVALLVLIDVSGSTDAWVSAALRIVDVEKEALLIVSSALEALALDSAVYAFSGHGPHNVTVRPVKRFEERFGPVVQRRIAALEPEEYTRVGAAIRHACTILARQPRSRRLLLLLSDGKPNDCDRYEGRYGLEDFRQAIAEARLQGIAPFCVTVDRQAGRHLPGLFGPRDYSVVREPQHLSRALLDWLRAAALARR
jgi:nitric oxide reductase NorD protein